MDEADVQLVDDDEARAAAQEGVGVLHGLAEVLRVHVRREGGQRHEQGEGQRQREHDAQQDAVDTRVVLLHQRAQHEDQHQRAGRAHAHVQRRMNAQIHAREANQHRQHDADYPHGPPLGPQGDAAEGAHRVLGMAAGEGVAPRPGPGLLHDGEVLIHHPGARHAAHDLQPLIHHRAAQAAGEQEVALLLAHAPEHHQTQHQKNGFVAHQGQGVQQAVANRVAQALQQSQKAHQFSLFSLFSNLLPGLAQLYQISVRMKRPRGKNAPGEKNRMRLGLCVCQPFSAPTMTPLAKKRCRKG